ncbi:type II secretion system protein [Clostridium sp. cel8]|jgi:prepilin-type N-terminal cleavage/methylation domain-containing protein|uniref:pilus assembly FimT family protein n=1 Tax=unclassified Clostridium TaxID=2614128 RepID=UPI0015F359CD|nr:type II secretion system protein [Clostridium sp. cel8]MBA5850632.1 type II secretion system protein [Clostridium sp. cel8]
MKFILLSKRGFTLIELLLVLSIISIVFSYSFINLSSFGNFKNQIDVDVFENEFLHFTNMTKAYCRDRNIDGYIRFDPNNNIITFNSNVKTIFVIKIPRGFELKLNVDHNRIDISSKGVLEDACSINFIDRKENIHCITICVGTFYEDIKY